MSAPIVSIDIAGRLYHQNRPFCVTLKYDGPSSGKSGWSSKWWQLTYDGTPGGDILCNHGATGTTGRKVPFRYNLAKCRVKVIEKEKKGYVYSGNTSHRMPPAPKPKAPPKIVLEGIFAEIRVLKKVADDHFEAYDNVGTFLLDLTQSGVDQVLTADPFRIRVTAGTT
jgi:hypothetical protein